MAELRVSFIVRLEDFRNPIGPWGPYFHRWLPDGRTDALDFDTDDGKAELKLWFERRGFVEHGFVEFRLDRREVDSNVMRGQGVLDAGPLHGEVHLLDVPEEQVQSVCDNAQGSPPYISLGKRLIKKIIHPCVSKFLYVLRTSYGQYWLPHLTEWDSRSTSIGHACSLLQMQWSRDGGITWSKFRPDESALTITVGGLSTFSEYLSEQDWRNLARVVSELESPTLAASLVPETRKLMDEGNYRHALVDAVTALELALASFMRRRTNDERRLQDSLSAFWNLPLATQLTTVALLLPHVEKEDIGRAVEAIQVRNQVIHEGLVLIDAHKESLMSLLRIIALLLPGPPFRFPALSSSNRWAPPESWDAPHARTDAP